MAMKHGGASTETELGNYPPCNNRLETTAETRTDRAKRDAPKSRWELRNSGVEGIESHRIPNLEEMMTNKNQQEEKKNERATAQVP